VLGGDEHDVVGALAGNGRRCPRAAGHRPGRPP
jgi:hypothetical protein